MRFFLYALLLAGVVAAFAGAAAEFHVVMPQRQSPALYAREKQAVRQLLHRPRQGLP
jgi:hypothetical protein